MENFSTRTNIDYYYNQERRWSLSDLEDSEEESDNDGLINFKLRRNTKYIVINSIDRDWTNIDNNETPYKYSVKTNCSNQESNFFLVNNLKNVIGLAVFKMLLPCKPINIDYSTQIEHIVNTPYMVVDIKGHNNSIYGTNNVLNSATAPMISLTPIPINNVSTMNIKTLEFKNMNNSRIEYSINPIASINSFDIEIKNNFGKDPIDNVQDVLEISNIMRDNINLNVPNDHLNDSLFIYLKTKTCFTDTFQEGDTILIRNFAQKNTTLNNNYNNFLDFINRNEGHKIIQIGKHINAGFDLTTKYKNVIKISRPFVYDITTMNNNDTINSEQFYIDLIGNDLEDHVEKNTVPLNKESSGGVLINTSLQTTLFINVETLEKETNIKSQLI